MSDTRKDYNGWKNYETWDIKLWIDNDIGLYESLREMGEYFMKQYSENDRAYYFSLHIRDLVYENAPLEEASMYNDILYAGLDRADYYEIAESILEELKER